MTKWVIAERQPQAFGIKRKKREQQLDKKYPQGWQEAFRWGDIIIPKSMGLKICEDAYYSYLLDNYDVLGTLIDTAIDVYEQDETDIDSIIYYNEQEGIAFHYTDIAVRRVVMRLGKTFNGETLIQIPRPPVMGDDIMPELSSYNVPFHISRRIIQPGVKGEWIPASIEDFYQSNRVIIAVKETEGKKMEEK